MKYLEVVVEAASEETVRKIAEKVKAKDVRTSYGTNEEGMIQMRLLVQDHQVQTALDLLQGVLGAQHSARILVMQIEAYLPKETDETERDKEDKASAARESLYDSVEKNAHVDSTYLLLVALSTVVASVGMIQDSPAVVIGAMVIAPLLGPNLALSFGTALGDWALMRKALISSAAGLGLAIGLSMLIGLVWTGELDSAQLTTRTEAGADSVVLALTVGAAAALSLVSGLSSVLVGVMVAVALLPPAATLGLMLGSGQMESAMGAALLLSVNVVCINLVSKIVFLCKGIRPRTWMENEKARKAMRIVLLVWAVTLGLLILMIYLQKKMS